VEQPFVTEALPKHRRRLQSVDKSITDLWLDGLATRDFEGTLRAFLGTEGAALGRDDHAHEPETSGGLFGLE
jgi:hypothetical protein